LLGELVQPGLVAEFIRRLRLRADVIGDGLAEGAVHAD